MRMNMSDSLNKLYSDWVAPDFSSESGDNSKIKLGSGRHLPTADELQKIYKSSDDEGFSKGYSEGLSSAEKKINDKISLLTNLINILNDPLIQVSDNVLDYIKQMSLVIAGQIVRRELSIDPNNIISTIQKSIELLNDVSGIITLYINPEDVHIIEDIMSIKGSTNIKILDDPTITRGGCRVITEVSTIDATIEKQLRNIASEMIGGSRVDDNQY